MIDNYPVILIDGIKYNVVPFSARDGGWGLVSETELDSNWWLGGTRWVDTHIDMELPPPREVILLNEQILYTNRRINISIDDYNEALFRQILKEYPDTSHESVEAAFRRTLPDSHVLGEEEINRIAQNLCTFIKQEEN